MQSDSNEVTSATSELCSYLLEAMLKSSSSEDDATRSQAVDWLRINFTFESLSRCGLSTELRHEQAVEWMSWARAHKHLKFVSVPVPDGILPDGITGVLHDVKVFTRYGPDDAIYDSDEDIRNKVARGNCFLELSQSGCKSVSFCVIHALKKFTGGLGDDDDRETGTDSTWKMYFRKPIEEAQSVVCTSKVNGEAAHLGACRIGSKYYMCAGSKNVHILFASRNDLELYNLGDPRYTIAREVCYCILDKLESMSEEARMNLLAFLSVSHSTAVFEILNPSHSHVEDLSGLTANQLIFIAWTSCNLQPSLDLDQLCTLPPDSGVELAKLFGLDTVSYVVIPLTQLDQRIADIRHKHGLEGEVFFFLDADRTTIGMLKKKSVWYIVVRAIREKVRAMCKQREKDAAQFSMSRHQSRVRKRLCEIQEWLQLDGGTIAAWQELASKFLYWCVRSLDSNSLTVHGLTNCFPVHWNAFLIETGETDKIPVSVLI